MWVALQAVLGGIAGSLGTRVLVGTGLALAVATGLDVLVSNSLSFVVAQFSGLPANIGSIVLLFGLGEALSILGAALLTRAVLAAALVGVAKT